MVHHVNEEWVRCYPARKKKRQFRYFSTITTILFVGIAINSLSFWIVGGAVALFYAVSLIMEPTEGQMNALFRATAVEVKDDGLHQSSLNVSGFGKLEECTISTITPWKDISLKSASIKGSSVKKIVLEDRTLPFGARTITLENFERMSELLSQIKTQLADTT